jgi:hypothetical protein
LLQRDNGNPALPPVGNRTRCDDEPIGKLLA